MVDDCRTVDKGKGKGKGNLSLGLGRKMLTR